MDMKTIRKRIRELAGPFPGVKKKKSWLEEQGGTSVEYDLGEMDPDHKGQQFRGEDGEDMTMPVKKKKRKK